MEAIRGKRFALPGRVWPRPSDLFRLRLLLAFWSILKVCMTSETRKLGRPRDEQLAERRREEILDVAARLFAQRGFSETDTQMIADEIGVGKGTVYRYFASKRELFLAAVDRGMHRLSESIEAEAALATDALDEIARGVRAYLAFFEERPQFAELLIQERAAFRDRQTPTYFEHRAANVGRWHNVYRRLIAEGRMRDVPVEQACDVMSQLLYGTMFTNFFAGRTKGFEQQAAEILDVTFFGLLSDCERTPRLAQLADQPQAKGA